MEPYWAWDLWEAKWDETRDVTAVGDDAGSYPEPILAESTYDIHCKRCGEPLIDRFYFCEPCNNDFWERAASYTDDGVEQDRIVTDLRRRFINGTA